jgi:hypothetical protein
MAAGGAVGLGSPAVGVGADGSVGDVVGVGMDAVGVAGCGEGVTGVPQAAIARKITPRNAIKDFRLDIFNHR